MNGRFIVRWLLILIVCVMAAALLARWWDSRADERMEARLRKASLEELERLSRERDWDPMVFYWLGERLTDAGRHKEAVKALARSAALNPASSPARAALGLALARSDRPDEAESQLKAALDLDPKSAFAHFTLGNLYGRYKRWEQAAKHLKAVSELEPNNLEAQYLLAVCYGELLLEDRKMALLENLVQRAPKEVRYLKSLGYAYLFFGRFEQAEATYRRVLQIAPQDLETRYLLGRSLAEQASTPEAFAAAEKELRTVQARVPDNPGVHLALGILYFRRNEPQRAIPVLERAIKLRITEHKTWLYLGQSYMRVGRAAEAKRTLAEFERGTRISRTISQLENRLLNTPEDTPERVREKKSVRLRLVRVYMEDNQYGRALNNVRLVLEHDPENAEARKLARLCLARLQKAEPGSGQRPAQ